MIDDGLDIDVDQPNCEVEQISDKEKLDLQRGRNCQDSCLGPVPGSRSPDIESVWVYVIHNQIDEFQT